MCVCELYAFCKYTTSFSGLEYGVDVVNSLSQYDDVLANNHKNYAHDAYA